jgi:hypothetical protein
MVEGSKETEEKRNRATVPTVSRILADGSIVELLYRPDEHRTAFAIYSAGGGPYSITSISAQVAELLRSLLTTI